MTRKKIVAYNKRMNKYEVTGTIAKQRRYYGVYHTKEEANLIALKLYEKRYPEHLTAKKSHLRGEEYRKWLCTQLGIPYKNKIPSDVIENYKQVTIQHDKTGYTVCIKKNKYTKHVKHCKTLFEAKKERKKLQKKCKTDKK